MHITMLPLKMPEELNLYGLYVYYVVQICDFGTLRVKAAAPSFKPEIRLQICKVHVCVA